MSLTFRAWGFFPSPLLLLAGVFPSALLLQNTMCMHLCVHAQTCLIFCNNMDCSSPPGSSVHGIFQAEILEWVAISFSRGSSYPGFEPASPALILYHWATREAHPPRSAWAKFLRSNPSTLREKLCLRQDSSGPHCWESEPRFLLNPSSSLKKASTGLSGCQRKTWGLHPITFLPGFFQTAGFHHFSNVSGVTAELCSSSNFPAGGGATLGLSSATSARRQVKGAGMWKPRGHLFSL